MEVIRLNSSYISICNLSAPLPLDSTLCDESKDYPHELRLPIYLRITVTVACSVIFVIGFIGNLFIPVVVCHTKELHNSASILLVNLSLADLLLLLICMPTVLIDLHSRPEVWMLGHDMCKIVPYVELTVAHASVLTILAISIERYYAICKPLKAAFVFTKFRAVFIGSFLWILASSITCPVLFITEFTNATYIDESTVPVCVTTAEKLWHKLYFVFINLFFFWLPLGVLAVVYAIIGRTLVTDTRMLRSSSEKILLKARKQVISILGGVVVCFFTCLMPFRVFVLWIIFAREEDVQELGVDRYYNILYFSRVMLYFHSSINPVLYNVISCKFRQACFDLVCKGKDAKFSTPTTSQSSVRNTNHFKNFSVTIPDVV